MNSLDLSAVEDRTLVHVLRMQAERAGDLVFLQDETRQLSFAEVNRRVNALARGLAQLGVGRGDRVCFFMGAAIEVVLLVLAINKLGAVWIPINTDYKGDWLQDLLRSSQAKVIVVDEPLSGRLGRVIENVPHEHVVLFGATAVDALPGAIPFEGLLNAPDDEPDLSNIRYGDVSAVLWTSGTTGKSKGVMQSHNVWIRAAEHVNYESRPGDSVYSIMPTYNTAAWTSNIFRALVEGLPCAIDPKFSVSSFWDRLRRFNATQTFTLGAMHMFLWNQPERDDDAANPLRIAGMVPMPDALIGPFCERFGIERILQGFGQSETGSIITRSLSTASRAFKPGALGVAHDDVEIRLVDDDHADVPTDTPGEALVRGRTPHVIFEGYFDNPDANAASIQGGWFHTGDLLRCDEDGDYYFVDRKKDAIRSKGRNISTIEVEQAVSRHPAIERVAAYGITCEHLDAEQDLALAIVLKDSVTLTEPELARFINDNAPYFFVPRYIEFVDTLPYTPTGKVRKIELRQRGCTPAMWDRTADSFVLER
jgi:crotonobetaine/carnitine-CoA ligase